MSAKGPNLKAYIDKTIKLHLNKNRKVVGILRGFDNFMNIVLDDTVEETAGQTPNKIGICAVRGNSIGIYMYRLIAFILYSRLFFFCFRQCKSR